MDKANVIKRSFAGLLLVGYIAGNLGCAGYSKRENASEHIESSVITSKVNTAIYNDPMLKDTQINVDTCKHVVVLSGSVDSPEAAERAVKVARSVDGVRAVKNKMSVNGVRVDTVSHYIEVF